MDNNNNNNNMIECLYGHHLCEKEEFTQAGLNGPYKVCRK